MTDHKKLRSKSGKIIRAVIPVGIIIVLVILFFSCRKIAGLRTEINVNWNAKVSVPFTSGTEFQISTRGFGGEGCTYYVIRCKKGLDVKEVFPDSTYSYHGEVTVEYGEKPSDKMLKEAQSILGSVDYYRRFYPEEFEMATYEIPDEFLYDKDTLTASVMGQRKDGSVLIVFTDEEDDLVYILERYN